MTTVILVSFGSNCDPFTCSTEVPDSLLDKPQKILKRACKDQKIETATVDEVLVIQNNQVAKHYTRAKEDFS